MSLIGPRRALHTGKRCWRRYVAGCNRVGDEGNRHHYSGNSLILDPMGTVLAQAEPDAAACLQARLSLSTLRQYRETFPAWRDADRFSLQL